MSHADAPSPVRIVHCIGALDAGGSEHQLTQIIEGLAQRGFEQTLVVLTAQASPLQARIEASGCPIISLDWQRRYHWFDPRAAWDLMTSIRRYVCLLRKARPDLIHAKLYWANIASVIAAKLAGNIPVAISRLNMHQPADQHGLRHWLQNLANRHATYIFNNSHALVQDTLRYERHAEGKTVFIHNGINLERFAGLERDVARRELELAPDALVLTYCAILHARKAHRHLIEAVATLIPRYPTLKVLLPGVDKGERDRLQTQIDEAGLTPSVQLLGLRDDIPRLLSATDVYVHCSLTEGFSNAILESMAAGLPAVVTLVAGNPEAVEDGVSGLLVPPDDPAALSQAIDQLLGDPARREAMGKAARRRVEEHFASPIIMEHFADWYRSVAQVQRSRNESS